MIVTIALRKNFTNTENEWYFLLPIFIWYKFTEKISHIFDKNFSYNLILPPYTTTILLENSKILCWSLFIRIFTYIYKNNGKLSFSGEKTMSP